MLGNKIDVEENKRVVRFFIERVWGIAANLRIDLVETSYDFLSVEGWNSLF